MLALTALLQTRYVLASQLRAGVQEAGQTVRVQPLRGRAQGR